MERKEYKVNINVLGSNNGQKVRRGIKPGLLVEESDGVSNNLYLFTHNRALNNCNYSGKLFDCVKMLNIQHNMILV